MIQQMHGSYVYIIMFYTYFTKMGLDNPTTTNEQTARSDFFVLFCAPYKYSYLLTYLPNHSADYYVNCIITS